MRPLALLTLFLFALPIAAQDKPQSVKPPAKEAKFKAVSPMNVKAGEHIVIDASSAAGEVFFFYDETAFPAKRATQCGKKMILSTNQNGTYTIHAVSLKDEDKQKVVVTVTGGGGPVDPVDPIPTDPLEALKLEMRAGFARMEARLLALEQIKPNPQPGDPLVASLQRAYELDKYAEGLLGGKTAPLLSKLTAMYSLSSTVVNDPANKTPSAVFVTMHKAIGIQLQEPTETSLSKLPNTRRAIAAELDKYLPLGAASTQEMTPETRQLINTHFGRIHKALQGVAP